MAILVSGDWFLNASGVPGVLHLEFQGDTPVNWTLSGRPVRGFWNDRELKLTFETSLKDGDPQSLRSFVGYLIQADGIREIAGGFLDFSDSVRSTHGWWAVPASDVTWESLGPVAVADSEQHATYSARVFSIALTQQQIKSNSSLFIGVHGGGVWRSKNFDNIAPQWTPVTDSLENLSLSNRAFELGD